MRPGLVFIISLALACATTLAVAWYVLATADRATSSSSSILVRNGTEAWLIRRHSSFGLEWINCGLVNPPLVTAQTTLIDIPTWAVPPPLISRRSEDRRVATLAVGWPMPFVTRQWSTASPSQIFPIQIDLDEGHESLRRAAARFHERDQDAPRTLLWSGLAIDLAIFTLVWIAIVSGAGATMRALSHRQKRDDDAHQEHQS